MVRNHYVQQEYIYIAFLFRERFKSKDVFPVRMVMQLLYICVYSLEITLTITATLVVRIMPAAFALAYDISYMISIPLLKHKA